MTERMGVIVHSMVMSYRMCMRHCMSVIANRMSMGEAEIMVVVAIMRVAGDVRFGQSELPSTAVAPNIVGSPSSPLRTAVGIIPDGYSTAKVGNAAARVAASIICICRPIATLPSRGHACVRKHPNFSRDTSVHASAVSRALVNILGHTETALQPGRTRARRS